MPNDAKLGLVVGVCLVMVVAVVFFNKDLAPDPAVDSSAFKTTGARATARDASKPAGVNHTVKEGETLAGLAQHYYGDRELAREIVEANKLVVSNPEQVSPGTVVFIPDLGRRATGHTVAKTKPE